MSLLQSVERDVLIVLREHRLAFLLGARSCVCQHCVLRQRLVSL